MESCIILGIVKEWTSGLGRVVGGSVGGSVGASVVASVVGGAVGGSVGDSVVICSNVVGSSVVASLSHPRTVQGYNRLCIIQFVT